MKGEIEIGLRMNSEGGGGFDWKPQKRQKVKEWRKGEATERRKEKEGSNRVSADVRMVVRRRGLG